MNKNQYCDNPEKYYEYTKNMSRDDFKNLQEYCDIYLYEKKSAKGKIKQGVYDLGKDLENIPDIIVNMIYSMFFTREGIENLALILGVTESPKLIKKIGQEL